MLEDRSQGLCHPIVNLKADVFSLCFLGIKGVPDKVSYLLFFTGEVSAKSRNLKESAG